MRATFLEMSAANFLIWVKNNLAESAAELVFRNFTVLSLSLKTFLRKRSLEEGRELF